MDVITTCGFLVGFFFLMYPNFDILYNKDWWGISCVLFCCLMTSGQVWNDIQNPPFFSAKYFSHANTQCVSESFLIVFFYAAVIVGMIMITEAASSNTNIESRRAQATGGLTITMLFFSLIIIMLRSKAGV